MEKVYCREVPEPADAKDAALRYRLAQLGARVLEILRQTEIDLQAPGWESGEAIARGKAGSYGVIQGAARLLGLLDKTEGA